MKSMPQDVLNQMIYRLDILKSRMVELDRVGHDARRVHRADRTTRAYSHSEGSR